MKWTCKGSVRGACGIAHRTRKAAEACCKRDQAAVRPARLYKHTWYGEGPYSDRQPVALDDEARQEDARW